MSKKKQIEEMAIAMAGCGKADCSSCKLRCEGLCASYKDASRAYAAGYRKQHEGENVAMYPSSEFECSECHWEDWDLYTADSPYNFCPNCGAKMKGCE